MPHILRRTVYVTEGISVAQVQEALETLALNSDRVIDVVAVERTADYPGYDVAVRVAGTADSVDQDLCHITGELLGRKKTALDVDLATRDCPMLVSFARPADNDEVDGQPARATDVFFVECLVEVALELIERFGLDRSRDLPPWFAELSAPRGADSLAGDKSARSVEQQRRQAARRLLFSYGYEPEVPWHRPGDSERIGFLISRDLSTVETEVLHHPYHQLYNAYSPWWQLPKTLAIGNLSELSTIEFVGNMIPLGIVSDHSWRPLGWTDDVD